MVEYGMTLGKMMERAAGTPTLLAKLRKVADLHGAPAERCFGYYQRVGEDLDLWTPDEVAAWCKMEDIVKEGGHLCRPMTCGDCDNSHGGCRTIAWLDRYEKLGIQYCTRLWELSAIVTGRPPASCEELCMPVGDGKRFYVMSKTKATR